MKKWITLFTVTVCLAMAMPAKAQIKFGVKGGLNLASASLSDAWDAKGNADNYTGFFIGPMVDITIPIIGLGVDGALMYSQKGAKISFDDDLGSTTFKQQGIEIPVNLKYSIGLGSSASIYFAAGPSFYFNMKSDDDLTFDTMKGSLDYDKSEVSLNLGAGVKLLRHLQLGVNYNMGLTDSAKAKIDSSKSSDMWDAINGESYKSKIWQVSVAYLF
ncbi:porin family protein [Bacteroides graminisolvens]|uniref:porin family protein n=1 Tax=Bacteroides graminisolvens TaxID=477666 RepID=UPI0023F06B73|nr:porin family protein [Bacteroides graminisolvens]MDD3210133.1 porin family protein [Bacteroides graminisolvens]